MDARATLAPYGVTLREAIAMLLPQLKAANRSSTVTELSAELLKAKKADGASDRYRSDLKSRMKKFTDTFGTRTVASITSADIDGWLRSLNVAPVTRNNFRRVLNVAFNFAKLQGYSVGNPAENTAEAKDVDKPAAILTPTQASTLLENCPDNLIPYVAVALFAGLRAAELEKLDWKEIDLAGGFVEVTALKSKTARRRLVPISDNLRAWLQPLVKTAGPVAPVGLRKRFEAVREAAGFKAWESNAMRHSYGSYRLAQCHDAAKVSLEMGNSPAMVFSHYRELVKPKESEQYWCILPAIEANNVVAMTA
jgi:integrase